jgi:hypothetical protein
VADPCLGDQVEDAVGEAEPRAQDRDHRDGARERDARGGLVGGLDRHGGHGEVARRLEREQGGEFAHGAAEPGDVRVAVAQPRHLQAHEGVVHHAQVGVPRDGGGHGPSFPRGSYVPDAAGAAPGPGRPGPEPRPHEPWQSGASPEVPWTTVS